jgi:uncharacterized protein YjdB/uncharacterized protein YkwD
LPKGLTTIEGYAFRESGLTEVTIPDSVTTLGCSAFSCCYDLKKVVIGNGIKEIEDGAFDYCESLTDITFGKNIKKIGGAFGGCTSLKSVVIPDTVTEIGDYCFNSDSQLISVKFSKNLKSIGYAAFANTALSSVTLPSSLETIGDGAFYNTSIKSVTIPASVTSIGKDAFPEDAVVTTKGPLVKTDEGGYESEKDITKFSYQVEYDQSSARSMLNKINSFRKGSEAWYYNEDGSKKTVSGLSNLVYDYDLEKVAMQRAAEIAICYGHTRPDGTGCFAIFPDEATSCGENIAYGYSSVDSVMEAWKETYYNYSGQGHRRNMLSSNFNVVGIGHVKYNGTDYWVQDFAYISNPNKTSTSANNSTTSATSRIENSTLTSKGKVSLSTTSIYVKKKGATSALPTAKIGAFSFALEDAAGQVNGSVSKNSWFVEDSSVASIKNGKVTALKDGASTFLYTYVQGTKYRVAFRVGLPSVQYRTYVQTYRWQNYVMDGALSGTAGQSKRLEGIQISLKHMDGITGGIQYKTYVQKLGWQDWVSNGKMSGTKGRKFRLEAIQIKLTGNIAQKYDVYYRVHAQHFGWLDWAKNGASSGTSGYGYRLEAIQIQLVKKGQSAPGSTSSPYHVRTSHVYYTTHVQNIGWQNYVRDGVTAGTVGKGLRLEGIKIYVKKSKVSGGVQYKTYVQKKGWVNWSSNNTMSGTSGQSLRLEAIQIKLTGDLAEKYDIYYRVHAQNIGWMGWAKNGESAGTAGYSYRLEGIQIVVEDKGEVAPGSTKNAFVKK